MSTRIRRLYRTRSRRRDYAVNVCVRDLVERLSDHGVQRVVIGDLPADLPAARSAHANEMVHNFWSYGHFIDQLQNVCEKYGPDWRSVCETALERDEYMCQACGATRGELGRNPDVHHITPVR